MGRIFGTDGAHGVTEKHRNQLYFGNGYRTCSSDGG